MDCKDLVSIITPSYNTGNYIIATIKSAQAQTYTNWEMIIVDDCSTDNTLTVIADYLERKKEKRVRVLSNVKRSGAALSRNFALREAKGKWIAFLDSDDLWMPEKLYKQIRFMKENNYHFSYTNYEEIDEQGRRVGIKITGPKRITKHGMYNYCWPGCLTVMYDREEIGLVEIEDIKKNNDYAMWLKIIKKANCYLLDDLLAQYRKRNGSISNHGYLQLINWHYRLFKYVEHNNKLLACINTIRNIIFGCYKKMRYVKVERE